MTNKFAQALKPIKNQTASPPDRVVTKSDAIANSRKGMKHIGGYFDPVVAKQLKMMAAEEETTLQNLLEEAFDLLFQSRQKPTIARKQV